MAQGADRAPVRQILSKYPIFNKNNDVIRIIGYAIDIDNYLKPLEKYRVTLLRP